MDIDYNNTYFLNLTLKNCYNNNHDFPVSLYSYTKSVEETRKNKKTGESYNVTEPLANRIITLYSFVSFNRNCLAHASNESGVKPETLKKRFKELMDLIRNPDKLRPKQRRKQAVFCLKDSAIRDKESEIESNRDKIIKDEIEHELRYKKYWERDNKYGLAHFYVTEMPDKIRNYKDAYATHQILYALSGLAVNWSTWKNLTIDNMKELEESEGSVSKLMDYLTDEKNLPFIELLIEYCIKNDIPVPQFAKIKKKKEDYIQSSKSNVKHTDVLRVIKNEIHSFKDLYNKAQLYTNLDNWNYKKKEIQTEWNKKGADDEITENRTQLVALLSSLGKDSIPKRKYVIKFFLDENNTDDKNKENDNRKENFKFLLGKLRLDHK